MKIKNKKIILTLIIILLILLFQKNVLAATDIKDINYITNYVTEYTGKDVKLPATFYDENGNKLIEGEDYVIEYPEDNKSVGSKLAKITGKGNYTGSFYMGYAIAYKLTDNDIASIPNQKYKGKEITPNITVKYNGRTLTKDVDYTVSYFNNNQVGKATVTITGKGNYTGSIQKEFNIVPDSVKNVAVKIKSYGVKIGWSKNEYATGYQIYRATSKNGKYTKIGTNYYNATTTFKDTTAQSGKKYYYAVKSYVTYNGKEYTSPYSTVKSIVNMKTPTLTVTSYSNQAKLTWSKIENASGYKIYRATSKDGTYTRIKTITGNSTFKYWDKNVGNEKEYYYKINVYTKIDGKNVYSECSAIEQKTALQKTVVKSAKNSSSKNVITWSKVSGVTGYRIYRSTSENGKYTKIKTISNNSTFSYTDKNLSLGKVYYYKIRAYKTKSGKTQYGQYSDIATIVTGSRYQQLNKVKLQQDEYLYPYYKDTLKKIVNDKMSTYEKVKACYTYVVKNMYHKDGYNCKHFSATFTALVRSIGIDAYCYSGQTTTGSGGYTAHTWVQLDLNGKTYIFDPSIDRHLADSAKKTVKYDRFFKTQNELKGKYKYEGYTAWWTAWCVLDI